MFLLIRAREYNLGIGKLTARERKEGMMIYVLICLSMSLAGVAGLQFFYMIYLDRMDKEQKKRLRILERRCSKLTELLKASETQISEQEKIIESICEERGEGEEAWADTIE